MPGLMLAIVMGLAGQAVAQAPRHGLLLVTNQGDRSLSILDADTGKLVATVPEGATRGHEVAASPDGKTAYVPIYGDSGVGQPGTDGSTMLVIDVTSHKITGHVDFGKGVRPHLPVFCPKTGMLYVTTELDQSITIVDPKTLRVAGRIPTGQPESHMLAVSHDGRRGYTANVGPGTVSVLDLGARKTITVIPISGQVQRVSISPDDKLVFTSDQTKPRLAVIDTATNKVKTWVPLPGAGYGTASTPDGKWLLVAVPSKNQVAVVNLGTMKVAWTLDVPPEPQSVLVLAGRAGRLRLVQFEREGRCHQHSELDRAGDDGRRSRRRWPCLGRALTPPGAIQQKRQPARETPGDPELRQSLPTPLRSAASPFAAPSVTGLGSGFGLGFTFLTPVVVLFPLPPCWVGATSTPLPEALTAMPDFVAVRPVVPLEPLSLRAVGATSTPFPVVLTAMPDFVEAPLVPFPPCSVGATSSPIPVVLTAMPGFVLVRPVAPVFFDFATVFVAGPEPCWVAPSARTETPSAKDSPSARLMSFITVFSLRTSACPPSEAGLLQSWHRQMSQLLTSD